MVPSTLTEPSSCSANGGLLHVVLVGDLADDLLENVLERDQALHLAVLVDHHAPAAPCALGTR